MSESDKTLAPNKRERYTAEDAATLPGAREGKADGIFSVGTLLLGRYEVLGELGRGGMGVVYRCLEKVSGTEVAVKTLSPELSKSGWEMEQIRKNFQIVHKLHHPHIANYNALELDKASGSYYLIMEYIAGEELRYYLRRLRQEGRFSVKEIVRLISQAAKAVDHAHEQRILHRDIKPANLMVDQKGNVKVLDFGLAAQIHSSLSKVSVIKNDSTAGTVSYMAPEQWRGQTLDERADQYALAATVYEIFAGVPPFVNADRDILRQCVLTETPALLRDVPEYINTAVLRALSKKPEERFESCTAFAEALSGEIQIQENRSSETTVENSDVVDKCYDLDYTLEELEKKAKTFGEALSENADYKRLRRNGNKAEKSKDYARAVRYFSDALAIGEKIVAEEEARRKAEEEARRKAEEEARRKAEEEVQRKAKIWLDAQRQGVKFSDDKTVLLRCDNIDLREVVIPEGVTKIGEGAFRNCGSLTSVTIPESVTEIGDEAFKGCRSLTSVTIPEGVTKIGAGVFGGCGSLTSVTIPEGVTEIGDEAFKGCRSLTSVTISEGVTKIGDHAFAYCSSLTSVTIPEGVTEIGDYAFFLCGRLTSVTIPEGVTKIGGFAFDGCNSLTSVTIPKGVTKIGEGAFRNCGSLTSVTIPESVTEIGGWAFDGTPCEAEIEAVRQSGQNTRRKAEGKKRKVDPTEDNIAGGLWGVFLILVISVVYAISLASCAK